MNRLTTYFPDRTPTWTEVVVVLLVIVGFVPSYYATPPRSWIVFVAGFVLALVLVGPVANSRIGRRVKDSFDRFPPVARVFLLTFVILGIGIPFWVGPLPNWILGDATIGAVISMLVYYIAFVAVSGEISGWTTQQTVDE